MAAVCGLPSALQGRRVTRSRAEFRQGCRSRARQGCMFQCSEPGSCGSALLPPPSPGSHRRWITTLLTSRPEERGVWNAPLPFPPVPSRPVPPPPVARRDCPHLRPVATPPLPSPPRPASPRRPLNRRVSGESPGLEIWRTAPWNSTDTERCRAEPEEASLPRLDKHGGYSQADPR